MRIAFLGTSEFAVPALQALVDAGHDVVAVYTRAPKPAGRGQQERKTPVHQRAERLGLSVRTPKTLKTDEEAAAFKALDLDAAVVVSYGHILTKPFLDAPVLGCINIHGSLLLAERTPISAADTAETVHDRLADMGATLIVSTLDGLMRRSIDPTPQPEEGVTYAHKLGKEEGVLDWRRPAAELERKVRAFHPWPGTSFTYNGEAIKVLGATLALAGGAPGTVTIARDGFPVVACGLGGLRLLKLQRPGKSAQAADAFLRGFPLPAGTVLPSPAVLSLPAGMPRYKITAE